MAPLTHIQVINLWPSIEAFRVDVGVSIEAARKWRQRGRIPPDRWSRVIDAAKRAGHKQVTLAALHSALEVA
jgi:hypothetical protein